ncbi:Transmembrane protein 8B [Chionoecetes opilio]|uniref:Transmembrane protein 8B n=1 Tax=Chionoecetes opilio TaxID=41210 RepID=A0A8J5D550_CHIOP|nr:Transmembrane protein 8B [Chionoecetes opilio]
MLPESLQHTTSYFPECGNSFHKGKPHIREVKSSEFVETSSQQEVELIRTSAPINITVSVSAKEATVTPSVTASKVIDWEEVWPNISSSQLVVSGVGGDPSRQGRGREQDDHQCFTVLPLTRIKHASDFTDTFLIQGPEWYSTWLPVQRERPVFTHLSLLPFTDLGGTLNINILMDELLMNATQQLISVVGCVRKGRPPHTTNTATLVCDSPHTTLNITSHSHTTLQDLILVPFPEPDVWFLALQLVCYSRGSVFLPPQGVKEGVSGGNYLGQAGVSSSVHFSSVQ